MTVTAIAGIVMIALIFVTLAFGFPIGLSIGLGSAAALYIIMPNQGFLTVSAQKMFQSVNSFSLLAIPFFAVLSAAQSSLRTVCPAHWHRPTSSLICSSAQCPAPALPRLSRWAASSDPWKRKRVTPMNT